MPVGQAGNRIVHREVTKLAFTGSDGGHGAPHVAHHQNDEQHDAHQRDGDKRRHARHDRGAGQPWLTGKVRDGVALSVGECDDALIGGRLSRFARAPCRSSNCRRLPIFASSRSFDGFNRKRNRGAALPWASSSAEPTATAATIAGLLPKRSISAVLRPGFAAFWRGDYRDGFSGMALSRPRIRSIVGEISPPIRSRRDRAGAESTYLICRQGRRSPRYCCRNSRARCRSGDRPIAGHSGRAC